MENCGQNPDVFSVTASNDLTVKIEGDFSAASAGTNLDPCESCLRQEKKLKCKKVMKKLIIAATLYVVFMVGELIGGYVSNSLAIMTDAVHMLTDVVGILISLLALWFSTKPPTKRFTFGLHRLEVLSAVVSVILIYVLTAVLLYEAVQRTMSQDFDIDGNVMIPTAAAGVIVNIVMGCLLNQSGHVHSHGQSHSHGPAAEQVSGSEHQQKAHGSLAVRAAFIHALGDLLQSIGVLITAIIVLFKPEYKLADPICTYIFSVLVICTTFHILRDTTVVLLEGAPRHLDTQQIREDFLKLESVHSVDELHIWALSTDKTAALVHLQLTPSGSSNWEEVQSKARHLLLHTYGFSHCTCQLQTYKLHENYTCSKCRGPTA